MCRPEGGGGKRDAGSSKGKCSCGRLVPNDKSRIGFSTPQHQGKSTCWGSRLVSERPVGQRSTRFVREFGAVCRLSADLVQIFLHYQRPGAHELETNEAEYQKKRFTIRRFLAASFLYDCHFQWFLLWQNKFGWKWSAYGTAHDPDDIYLVRRMKNDPMADDWLIVSFSREVRRVAAEAKRPEASSRSSCHHQRPFRCKTWPKRAAPKMRISTPKMRRVRLLLTFTVAGRSPVSTYLSLLLIYSAIIAVCRSPDFFDWPTPSLNSPQIVFA